MAPSRPVLCVAAGVDWGKARLLQHFDLLCPHSATVGQMLGERRQCTTSCLMEDRQCCMLRSTLQRRGIAGWPTLHVYALQLQVSNRIGCTPALWMRLCPPDPLSTTQILSTHNTLPVLHVRQRDDGIIPWHYWLPFLPFHAAAFVVMWGYRLLASEEHVSKIEDGAVWHCGNFG